jgi:lipoate-protein ligase A
MALDIALLGAAEAGRKGLRVYTWDGLWVSLGRSQQASQVLRNPETPWVARPTGGAAVLHGHDVTVSIALPLPFAPGSVRQTYRLVTRLLVQALLDQGVSVSLAEDLPQPERSYKDEPDCFATTTRNDLVDPSTGQKVCGCALRRTRSAVLLQASIPVREPLAPPEEVLIGGVRTAATALDSQRLLASLEKALAGMQ